MSDSLMAFQPSMDEPSNMKPSASSSSPTTLATMVRCCHLPLGSVKRRSTHSISFSSIIFRTSFRSEEHTSELQSLMRISYAVFCLKKKNYIQYMQLVHRNKY